MAKLLNADYWKKAYLLEFRINGKLSDAFSFSVPPENEEFSFPQRKSETKTFGGAVVADYGNDLVQINLSGSTINQEVKLIYKSTLGYERLTGEQEIFLLRDLLKTFGQRDKLKGKEVYLYSLNGGGNVSHNPKWWRIYVGQLDVSRNKDKPFCYNYKFSATGEPEVISKHDRDNVFEALASAHDNVGSWNNKIEELIAKMNNTADKLEELGAGYLKEASELITKAKTNIYNFNAACKRYTDIVSGLITGVGDISTDTIMLGDKVLYSALRFYPTILASVWNSCVSTCETFKALGNYLCNIDDIYFSTSSWQTIKELFDDSVSNQDIADVYSSLAYEGIISANRSVAITSKNLNDLGFAVVPGNTGEDDRVITTYGYKVVSITDGETNWDQLAQDYYGDASLGSIIATYNSQSIDSELLVGQSILIPKLNFAESQNFNNEVYNTPDIKDNYGKDLMIKDGDFSIYNGDLGLISGTENLRQALLNRYSTLVGARIRLEVYGIQASIGDALNASSSLIQASVHQTTIADPRVESVEDIQFNGNGDKLAVSVIYIDRNGSKQNFGGVI
ncbi:MAG: hypothetical protein J6O99_06010 [Methanobrevibacter sp.]|nr:hypothetical protein [Methanobrevibacter sp.]